MESRRERARREKVEAFAGGFKIQEGLIVPDDLPPNYILITGSRAIERRSPSSDDPPTVIDEAYADRAILASFQSMLGCALDGFEYQSHREEFVLQLSDGTGIEFTGIEGLHVSRLTKEQMAARPQRREIDHGGERAA